MAVVAHAAPPTIEQLTRYPTVSQIKISPGGKYLAVRFLSGDKHAISFVDRTSMKPVGGLALTGRDELGDFHWVSENRVIARVLHAPLGDVPYFYGELFAGNVDGSRTEVLFGLRAGEKQTGSHLYRKESDRAWATIVDVLPDDERHVLISSTLWSESQGAVPRALLLDVHSGRQRPVSVPVTDSGSEFFTDRQGRIRLVVGRPDHGVVRVKARPAEGDWIDIPSDGHGSSFQPVAIADEGGFAYVVDDAGGDKTGLYRLELDGSGYGLIYTHDTVDVTDVMTSADGRSVYALRVDNGYPSYLIFSVEHEEGKLFRRLLDRFAGNMVSVQSRTLDGSYWIVRVATDVNEGVFYLYERENDALHSLGQVRPDVDSAELASTRPISFPSLDKRTIHGYFTAARSEGTEPTPLVVLVHGGPAARDFWGYDPEVQVLATQGFSVLQINYRGSSGYGRAFQALGNRQWGAAVQQDVLAGTRWTIAQRLATEGQVCIMGTSFGAYSAVQSATLAPELFACVVANAGVYDLPALYREGDIKSLYFGRTYLEEAIGRDEEELERYSPVNHVARLQAPVFLAHGRQDDRAPFQQAARLRRELRKHDKPHEWFVKPRDDHGFYDNRNRTEYLERVIKFLKTHLQ